jgi:ribosomal protein L33
MGLNQIIKLLHTEGSNDQYEETTNRRNGEKSSPAIH